MYCERDQGLTWPLTNLHVLGWWLYVMLFFSASHCTSTKVIFECQRVFIVIKLWLPCFALVWRCSCSLAGWELQYCDTKLPLHSKPAYNSCGTPVLTTVQNALILFGSELHVNINNVMNIVRVIRLRFHSHHFCVIIPLIYHSQLFKILTPLKLWCLNK